MFVAVGARELLRRERQDVFADRYLKPLLIEARRLGLSPDDVIALIGQQTATAAASTARS